jgi:hypothetical protein
MSLKDLAEQMKSRGRKGDTELIHMTRGEVAGLQQLAEAAGGNLTRNPDTGLPEAFHLRSILPAILGFGLTAATGGAATPLMAGLGVGGFEALRTGDIGRGVMAGFGAAGGAGLAGGLGTAGNAAASQAATAANPAFMGPMPGAASGFEAAQAGFSGLGNEAGRDAFMQSMGGGMGALKTGAMAAAPMMYESMMPRPMGDIEEDDTVLPRYDYTAGLTGDYYGTGGDGGTFERRYFTQPTFTRRAAAGGIMQLAEGGETDPKDPARGMTGASAEAMRYLMGQSAMSPAAASQQQRIQEMAAAQAQPAPAPVAPIRARNPIAELISLSGDGGGMGSLFGSFITSTGGGGLTRSGSSSPRYSYDPVTQSYTRLAEGGIASLAKGGMKDGGFVIPADVVSMAGEGNTDAGYDRIQRKLPGATPIRGKDGGQADTVKTSIEGKQPARVAHGEMYIPPAAVKRAGGAKKLYAMMDKVREQATGKKKQIKPVDIRKALA